MNRVSDREDLPWRSVPDRLCRLFFGETLVLHYISRQADSVSKISIVLLPWTL